MPALFYLPKAVSLANSKLLFYQTATSTPQAVYTDEALQVAHSQPVEADGEGRFPVIYLDPTLPDYRVTHNTSADVLIYTVDDVPSNQNVQQSMRLQSTNPFLFLHDTDGTSGSRKYRIRAAGAAFEVQASNEAETVFTTILRYEAGILYSNETEVAVTSSGSFTGTLTGMAASTTVTVNYLKNGELVHLYIESGTTGTSNATTMSMSGLPAAITPTSDKFVPCSNIIDNGNSLAGLALISDSIGSITFSLFRTGTIANRVDYSSGIFTNSGSKGLFDGWSITYAI
jgi:hypothetical protein